MSAPTCTQDPLSACVEQSRDGCIVDTAPLSAMVRDFERSWQERNDATLDASGRQNGGSLASRADNGRFRGRRQVGSSWVDELEGRTQLRGRTPLSRWQIYNVRDARSQTTELRIADALVAALHAPMAFHDGTLTVRPNPKASQAARAACCAGSLVGAQPPAD